LTFKGAVTPLVFAVVAYAVLVFGASELLKLFIEREVVMGIAMLLVIVGGWVILLRFYLRFVEKRCELVQY